MLLVSHIQLTEQPQCTWHWAVLSLDPGNWNCILSPSLGTTLPPLLLLCSSPLSKEPTSLTGHAHSEPELFPCFQNVLQVLRSPELPTQVTSGSFPEPVQSSSLCPSPEMRPLTLLDPKGGQERTSTGDAGGAYIFRLKLDRERDALGVEGQEPRAGFHPMEV